MSVEIINHVHDIMQYTLVSVSRYYVGAVKRLRMDSWLEYMD